MPSLGECLDQIIGKQGQDLTGLSAKAVCAKLAKSVYPCPSLKELDLFLGILEPVAISDGFEQNYGVMRNFRVEKNKITCDIELLNHKKLKKAQIDFFLAAATRAAIKEFLTLQVPVVPNFSTEIF